MILNSQQTAALNSLLAGVPEDLIPGNPSVHDTVNVSDSAWLRSMKEVAREFGDRAAAYYNIQVREDRPSTSNRALNRLISSSGFPSWATVSYAIPSMLTYHTSKEPRAVDHIVFHSFGHSWHANALGGGWLNRTAGGEGVVSYQHDTAKVFIAKGSDPETLTHPQRVASAIRASVGSGAQTSAHFIIDRAGNLLIIGDVNNVMFISGAVNETSVSIALEEAFYLVKNPHEEAAVWSPEGSPPGTAGNVQYFAFSIQQLHTLSILCKKLEVAFPALTARNVNVTRKSLRPGDPPGYTMHDFISGSKSVDISPHFLTESLWAKFFELVDTQTHVNQTNIWQPTSKYRDFSEGVVSAPIMDGEPTVVTERLMKDSQNFGVGLSRAVLLASADKAQLATAAGDDALNDSRKVAQIAANTYNLVQQTEDLPATLVEGDLADNDQGGWDDTWG